MDDRRNRNFFWPILLIAVGVVWLLGNLNIFPRFNFGLLFNLWPLLLVIAGIQIIFGRRAPLLRALLNLAIVGFALAYVYLAPSFGLVPNTEVQQASFSEPVGSAEEATVRINSSVGSTRIEALRDSRNLIEADVAYVGDIHFDVTGTNSKTIVLEADNDAFNSSFWDGIDSNDLRWEIGLTPSIPLVLDFSGGVGDIELDLTGLTLDEVLVEGGVGEVNITLPAQEGRYQVRIRGGVGEFLIGIGDGASIEMDIEAGVGNFVIDLPQDASVELRAETSVGNVRVPSSLVPVRMEDRTIGVSGTWQTENIDTDGPHITIEFRGGVGDLRLR